MFERLSNFFSLVQSTKEPYGDVHYADPGFQKDKKKRYPLDTKSHIDAAWKYIHKAKNRLPYTEEQLKHIEAEIVKAWKKMIDPKGPPEYQKTQKKT